MSILDDIILDEYERLQRLLILYNDKLTKLPKGFISDKKRNGNVYCYLIYRENKKTVSKYIGKESSENVFELRKKIKDRKRIENNIEIVKSKLEKLENVLNEEKNRLQLDKLLNASNREKKRLQNLLIKYNNELAELPKDSISNKKRKKIKNNLKKVEYLLERWEKVFTI